MEDSREAGRAAGAGNSDSYIFNLGHEAEIVTCLSEPTPVLYLQEGCITSPNQLWGQVFKFLTLSFKPSHKGRLELFGDKLFPELEPRKGKAQVHLL